MRKCLRVLKPGAHALVWAIPRRSHWTACAFEDAGFEIRNRLCVYFLSGFPKYLSVDKAIGKKLGANSPEAKQWEGWATDLKPAIEDWWLVRKPLGERTVADDVLRWGAGALNVGACRIPVYKPKSQTGWDYHHERGDHSIWRERFKEKAPADKKLSGWTDSILRPADPHPDSRYPSHFIVLDWELLGEHKKKATSIVTWTVQRGARWNYRRLGKHLARRNPSLFRNTSDGHGLIGVMANGNCRLITKASQLAPVIVDTPTMRVTKHASVMTAWNV